MKLAPILLFLFCLKSSQSDNSAILSDIVQEIRKNDHGYYRWENIDNSFMLPVHSVWGGFAASGENIYVGRYLLDDKIDFVSILPEKRTALVKSGQEISDISGVQVLVVHPNAQVQWVNTFNGNITYHTVPGGCYFENNGQLEVFYIGKSEKKKSLSTVTVSGKCLNEAKYCNKNYFVLEIVKEDPADRHPVLIKRANLKWVKSGIGEELPKNAYLAFRNGTSTKYDKIYVGRVYMDGISLPVLVNPAHKSAYATHKGRPVLARKYEVLVDHNPLSSLAWIKYQGQDVRYNAVVAGFVDNENAFVGYASINDTHYLGRIQPGHKCMYAYDEVNQKETCVPPQYVLVDREHAVRSL